MDTLKRRIYPALAKALGLGLLGALFVYAGNGVKDYKRKAAPESLNIVLSPVVQMFMAGGDRFLAANVAVWRSAVFPVEAINQDTVQAVAQVQLIASLLNPAHEDNFYFAQGILPWFGQIDATSTILTEAAKARPTDFLPLFFLGFNAMHFEKDFTKAGQHMASAASRMSGNQKLAMQAMAAKFYEKGDDPDFAIRVISGMQKSTRSQALKEHLQIRLYRLEMLKFLRAATTRFVTKFGRTPASLEELRTSGIVNSLPVDPLGIGFMLSPEGVPMIKLRKQ